MTNFVKINVPVFLTKASFFFTRSYFQNFCIGRTDIMISWREWTTLGSIPRIASCSWARGISASLRASWDCWSTRGGCRTDGMSPSPATRLGEQCCGSGSGIRCLFHPWIPNPHFWELSDNLLGKKFYNFFKNCPNFFLQHFKYKIVKFCEIYGSKRKVWQQFFFRPCLSLLFLDPGFWDG